MQAFTIIAVRLMAILFLINFITVLPTLLIWIGVQESGYSLTTFYFSLFFVIAAAAFIWILSKPIGRLVANNTPSKTGEDRIEINQIVHAGTFLIGFWIFAESLISLVQILPEVFNFLQDSQSFLFYPAPENLAFSLTWPSIAGMAAGVLVMGISKRTSKVFKWQAEKSS
jgi:Na+/phosphate symporter